MLLSALICFKIKLTKITFFSCIWVPVSFLCAAHFTKYIASEGLTFDWSLYNKTIWYKKFLLTKLPGCYRENLGQMSSCYRKSLMRNSPSVPEKSLNSSAYHQFWWLYCAINHNCLTNFEKALHHDGTNQVCSCPVEEPTTTKFYVFIGPLPVLYLNIQTLPTAVTIHI